MKSKTAIIISNELRGYFNSAAAYVVLVVFLLITGWFFANPLFLIGQAEMRSLFTTIPWIFLLFIPAITMGSISKEKAGGTIETLNTLPISNSQIIVGKFWGALLLTFVGLLFTLVHFVTIISIGSNIDYGSIICGYLGLMFVSGVYSAIGIFGSTITKNQIVAFIVSFLFVFFFMMIEFTLVFIPAHLTAIFQFLSINYHFSNISRGVIDSRNIIYFITLIVFFLRLSVIVMESRK